MAGIWRERSKLFSVVLAIVLGSQEVLEAVVTAAQALVAQWLKEWGYAVEFEYRFCDRRWRFDVAVPEIRVGIECNGHWNGRHGTGWSGDSEKTNTAQMLGWRCLTFANNDVTGKKGKAYEFLRAWFAPKQS